MAKWGQVDAPWAKEKWSQAMFIQVHLLTQNSYNRIKKKNKDVVISTNSPCLSDKLKASYAQQFN